eukprot:NODE_7912_length_1539_cov_7.127479.p1 GENE.NODE_7912_length_1539_cov_7.127479~~NODE_7912_length_1539_cov_7.127479.p1  ORF type:complete len:320 (+),score=60.46 NODE_7912_length_1539_cov_7.127479:130-1089(+)
MGQKCDVADHARFCCRSDSTARYNLDVPDCSPGEDFEHCCAVRSTAQIAAERGSADGLHNVVNLPMPQGGIYSGQVTGDGRPQGHGTHTWADGSAYTGHWKAGSASGRGKIVKSSGSIYEGGWLDGKKHGDGAERLEGIGLYKGEFVAGKRSGRGSLMWNDNASYVGEFREDEQDGEGAFIWNNGRSYRGQWVRSRMHGQGRFDWEDGNVYKGHYVNDRRHGDGVFTWYDGSQLMGTWNHGKHDGTGMFVDSTGFMRRATAVRYTSAADTVEREDIVTLAHRQPVLNDYSREQSRPRSHASETDDDTMVCSTPYTMVMD